MFYKIVQKEEEIAQLVQSEMIKQLNLPYISNEQTRYLIVLNDILSNTLYELREETSEKS